METAQKSVVIAGAGIIGLSTAWRLLRRGWDVTVLDSSPVSGASYAAAGMLAPVSEVVWDQPSLYPLMVESGRMYAEFSAAVAEDSGMNVGYLDSETFVCAGDSADRQSLTDLMGLQHQMGMDVRRITASQARRAEPALGPGCVGAVEIPGDHQIDPRLFTAAVLHILGDRVVRSQVECVLYDAVGKASVRTCDGTVFEADEIVLAAGLDTAGIGGLPDGLELPLRPVWGDVIRMDVPGGLQPLVTRTIRGIVQGRPVYIVPRADGSVVLGATSREDDMSGVSAQGVHQLLRDAYRLVPGILECEITELTTRARPGSPDDVPMIGRVAPNVTVSTGYFRHGILLAAIGSKVGADIVCGVDIDPATAAAVDPWRFSAKRNGAVSGVAERGATYVGVSH